MKARMKQQKVSASNIPACQYALAGIQICATIPIQAEMKTKMKQREVSASNIPAYRYACCKRWLELKPYVPTALAGVQTSATSNLCPYPNSGGGRQAADGAAGAAEGECFKHNSFIPCAYQEEVWKLVLIGISADAAVPTFPHYTLICSHIFTPAVLGVQSVSLACVDYSIPARQRPALSNDVAAVATPFPMPI